MLDYEQYIADVESGKIVTGELTKLAVSRFKNTLAQPGVTFDTAAYRRCLKFFGIFRHFKGKSAGKKFTLEPWQCMIVADIIGLKRNGKRLRQSVYVEIARKNGKTAFFAVLALYAALADGEMGAEADFAANSREQANIAYEFVQRFCAQIDPRGLRLKVLHNKVKDIFTASKMQVFAADASNLDGFDASFFLLDEFHAAADNQLFGVLQTSQGTREQPLGCIVTTAGFNKQGPCYKHREMCVDVLRGLKQDDALSAWIWSLDINDDWECPDVWIKANPNMGITVTPEYLAKMINEARNLPTEEVHVKTKNLNLWCDSATVWINSHYIAAATIKADIAQYKGLDCYAGIDLSATTDLTALSLMWVDGEKVIFKNYYFLPIESLNEPRFKERYGEWARQKLMILTPGNVTDYDFVLDMLLSIDDEHRLLAVAYDAWNATQFVIKAEEAKLPMKAFSQTLGNFNRPTKELERLLLSNLVEIDDNEITRWCFNNVTMVTDRNGNTKPTKQFAEKKIDGVIAMIEALGARLMDPRLSMSID